MAKVEFKIPELSEYPEVPPVVPGTMAHSKPFVAKPQFQEPLNFPGELPEDWHDKAIEAMGDLLGKYRSLQVYLDSCVKCGACTDKCHYYLGTSDPKNMPVGRQDLLRKVYRRHFTFAGKYFPKLVGAEDLTKEVLDDWYSYFHQCSQCRRCSVFCPYGIDTAEISMAAREIMDRIGVGQKYCNEIIAKVYKIGNNLGLPEPALADTLEGLEEDVEEETGVAVKYPLDVKGADILVVTPVGRLLCRATCGWPDWLWQGLSRGRCFLDPEFQGLRGRQLSACSSVPTRICVGCRCASARPHSNWV